MMSRIRLYMALSKAGLTAMVLVTTLVGFLLASDGGVDVAKLVWTVFGTALCAAGANALNQWWEVLPDSRMERTRRRPLPAGLLTRAGALRWAAAVVVLGSAVLLWQASALAAGLALTAVLVYVLAYTPLKRRTSLCTLVGAVVGALPPMIGWAAVRPLGRGAWLLAVALFVWQVPHFLALAWVYRRDYERGGFRMLPITDATGRTTVAMILLYLLPLLALGPAVLFAGVAGWWFAVGAIVLAAAWLALGVRLYADRTDGNARRVFLASLVYLPAMLSLLVLDRGPVNATVMVVADVLSSAH